MEVLYYISDYGVEAAEDIDYQHVLNKVCPGQTLTSLRTFITSIDSYQYKSACDDRNKTFLEKAQKRINSPKSARNLLDKNNDKTILRTSRMKEIVNIYEKIFKDN